MKEEKRRQKIRSEEGMWGKKFKDKEKEKMGNKGNVTKVINSTFQY